MVNQGKSKADGEEAEGEEEMTSKDIIIQPDVDGTGGMIFIHPGNREGRGDEEPQEHSEGEQGSCGGTPDHEG